MSEVDPLDQFIVTKEDSLRSQRDDYKRRLEKSQRVIDDLTRRYDLVTSIDAVRAAPTAWPVGKTRKGEYRGIANTISSDQHFGEIVNPREVQGANAYDLRIAKMRLRRHAERFVSLGLDHLSYLTYDGAHVWWNGDGFSGDIHEELSKSNEMSTLATVEEMVDPVCSFLLTIADAYKRVVVSVRRGNHTRTSKKVPAKGRVKESFDWLFMRIVSRELASDQRISFDIPESDDGEVITQYDHRFIATHGDQFRGGSGISGIMTPLSLGNYRKLRRNLSIGDHMAYDTMILGHFHQYLVLPNVIVNGALKGYDEYAYTQNFGYEDPLQAFWVTLPGHGPTFHAGIAVMDRKAEGW